MSQCSDRHTLFEPIDSFPYKSELGVGPEWALLIEELLTTKVIVSLNEVTKSSYFCAEVIVNTLRKCSNLYQQ